MQIQADVAATCGALGRMTLAADAAGQASTQAALPTFEDKYEKGDLIGYGNTGVVYAVTRKGGAPSDGTPLACKEILIEEQVGVHGTTTVGQADDDAATPRESATSAASAAPDMQRVSVQKAMKELKLLLTLRHPNLVELHDFWVESTSCKLVMTRLTGGELSDVLASRKSFTEEEARAAAIGILRGVSHMHSKGIAHRDLKLENVLVMEGRPLTELKIADFGMAKRIRVGTENTMCGSPMYVAPEVLEATSKDSNGKNIASYDFQADVWSVGVMLYTLLCGCPPFDTKGGLYALFQQIKRGMYHKMDSKAWSTVSDEAKDLVKRMLTVDPRQRISAVETFQHPWIKAHRKSEIF